jgi:hypothetical protein
MVAISNDIDCAAWNDFLLLHSYVNGRGPTALGEGLGLEMGDSFFFFSVRPDHDLAFSYFDDLEGKRRTREARVMDELMRTGYLDVLHSWGNYSVKGGFRRAQAEAAAAVLRELGNPVRVWINHGDEHNRQSIGTPGWDDSSAVNGHADILRSAGIEWVWTSALSDLVGQSRSIGMREAWPFVKNDVLRPLRQATARRGTNPFYWNSVTNRLSSRAGRFRSFVRYGSWPRASAEDLSPNLTDQVLDELEQSGGFMLVYVHLYKRQSAARLHGVDWSGFRRLADRERRGSLKVTTTSRLLRYHDAVRRLRWHSVRSESESRILVELPDVRHDVPVAEELAGLTFITPEAERTKLFVNGQAIATEVYPRVQGRLPGLGIPWRPLPEYDWNREIGA